MAEKAILGNIQNSLRKSESPSQVIENENKNLEHVDDKLIWTQFKAGDTTAYSKLMQMYYQDMFGFATKFTKDKEFIKDCLQELFLELWKNRSTISETNYVKAYLLKSIRHKIHRELYKIKRQTFAAALEEECNYFDVEFSVEQFIVSEQTLKNPSEKLISLLNQLPHRQKEIIYLRFFQELKVEQIVQIMGINPQSAYNLLHRAIYRLRQAWVSQTEHLFLILFLSALLIK